MGSKNRSRGGKHRLGFPGSGVRDQSPCSEGLCTSAYCSVLIILKLIIWPLNSCFVRSARTERPSDVAPPPQDRLLAACSTLRDHCRGYTGAGRTRWTLMPWGISGQGLGEDGGLKGKRDALCSCSCPERGSCQVPGHCCITGQDPGPQGSALSWTHSWGPLFLLPTSLSLAEALSELLPSLQ